MKTKENNLTKGTEFHCEECDGITYYVNYCDNPCCPNQPCCGKPKEQCDCYKTKNE